MPSRPGYARGARARPVRPGYDVCRHLLPRGSPAREPPSPARAGEAFLNRIQGEELRVDVHVACELLAGAELYVRPSVERERVQRLCAELQISYPDERFPPTYARLLASQERKRQRIATMDLLIAKAAVVDGAALVTRNPKDCLADHRPRGRCVLKGLGA